MFYDRLSSLGYKCFYDIESMRSGKFNEQLLRVIEECQDFVLILSSHALDRCVAEDDWVRREVTHALRHNKNLIPIMTRDFSWPVSLPAEISELPNYKGIVASTDYFDSCVERLTKLMHSGRKKEFKIGII